MKQQKMIINRSLYCNWRFEGCGDDWDDFIDSYGFSPQFLIDGKTIDGVSLDDIFWGCGYMYNDQIQNLKDENTLRWWQRVQDSRKNWLELKEEKRLADQEAENNKLRNDF